MRNYEKEIFKKRDRSYYKQFISYTNKLQAEEKEVCYYHFYGKMFNGWTALSLQEQDFLVSIIKHNWQLFLIYLLECTVMGRLRFKLHDGKGDAKIVRLNEDRYKGYKGSDRHFAFCLLLCFEIDMKTSIEALRRAFRKHPFFTDNLDRFIEYALEKQEEEGIKKKKK